MGAGLAATGESVSCGGGVTYYETLGVSPDATPDEIKRAYRAKASKLHPDREGGSDEEMSALNRAFECLSDPERRAIYDQTGADASASPLNDQARGILMDAFMFLLQSEQEHDRMQVVEGYIQRSKSKIIGERAQAENHRKKLAKRRDKIIAKDGENLFQMLIDDQITRVNQAIAQMDGAVAIHDAALERLKGYESIDEAMRPVQDMRSVYIGAGLGQQSGRPIW